MDVNLEKLRKDYQDDKIVPFIELDCRYLSMFQIGKC